MKYLLHTESFTADLTKQQLEIVEHYMIENNIDYTVERTTCDRERKDLFTVMLPIKLGKGGFTEFITYVLIPIVEFCKQLIGRTCKAFEEKDRYIIKWR